MARRMYFLSAIRRRSGHVARGRGLRAEDTPARDVRHAAVVGAGTMGGGIAMTYANAGIPVLLKDVDDDAQTGEMPRHTETERYRA